MNSKALRFCRAAFFMLSLMAMEIAYANPDVWVKAELTYHLSDSRVAGLTYVWHFDEYFSSRSIKIFDLDADGKLDSGEVEKLRRDSFDPLSQFDFYVHVWSGENKYTDLQVTEFSARIESSRLVYQFHLPLDSPAELATDPVIASLFDANTVVDFRFVKKNFLLVDGSLQPDCKFRVARGKGAQANHPQTVTLKCGA